MIRLGPFSWDGRGGLVIGRPPLGAVVVARVTELTADGSGQRIHVDPSAGAALRAVAPGLVDSPAVAGPVAPSVGVLALSLSPDAGAAVRESAGCQLASGGCQLATWCAVTVASLDWPGILLRDWNVELKAAAVVLTLDPAGRPVLTVAAAVPLA